MLEAAGTSGSETERGTYMASIRTFSAVTAALLLTAACSAAERDDAGEIAVAGAVDAFSIRVGDCYDDEMFFADEVTEVPGIPCVEPHDNEVFALFDLSGVRYPGDERVLDLADAGCLERFAGYVGADYDESVLMITTLVPSEESWVGIDDREVVCVAYHMELEKLTGSVRATGM